ncbi:MAG: PASTA domain-containing protein, partial [Oscillospiraceae bacterium]|nr:PASTA domain-containing protein [Oscillospiraceae bacterium]
MNERPNRRQNPGPQGRNRAEQGVPTLIKNRTRLLWGLMLVCGFGLLIGRLAWWQLFNQQTMKEQAASQQLMDVTRSAERGDIYDATGTLLATSTVVWNIEAAPNQFGEKANLLQISKDLAGYLGDGYNYEDILLALSDKEAHYKLLARQVEKPVAEAIEEYCKPKTEDEDGYERTSLPIQVVRSSKRVYPYGNFLSQVMGFCNSDGEGTYGLEKSYEEVLAGTDGRTITIRNRLGDAIPNDSEITYPAKDGSDLHLTIDVNIQSIVEKYLANSVKVNNVQQRGVGIVMDVNTGEILAMAIENGFDPNDPYALSEEDQAKLEGLSDEEYTELQKELRIAQWKNKAITELYYPGSVFKVVTTAAALDSNRASLGTTFTCGGSLAVADREYGCASDAVHGEEDMATALRNSCNIYYIQLGQQMGARTFYDYFSSFGFTEPTGIDLPYETPYMQYYNRDKLGIVEMASSSFGQAQKITPMQMATAVAAAVNGGYLVQPHVVENVVDAEGNITATGQTEPKRQVISEQVSALICDMMENVVESGKQGAPGRNAYVAGYQVAGKSGTSEKLDEERNEYGGYRFASSFCAVAPADDPEILVMVILDDPATATDSSLYLSGPCVGNIISEVAPYLGLDVQYTEEELAEPVVTVPLCLPGMDGIFKEWSMAQVELNKKGFEHHTTGEGQYVVYQYPAPYTKLRLGSTVYLYTDSETGALTTVPDLTGRDEESARTLLKTANLNCEVVGDAEGLVVAQDVDVGESVQMGTV